MKLNLIEEITILGCTYKIIYDKEHGGGCFDDGKITIGIKDLEIDPAYVLSIISHEIMEIIMIDLGARYNRPRQEFVYEFQFNHQTFENAIQLHTEAILKFICT